jgi:hypothetical protein
LKNFGKLTAPITNPKILSKKLLILQRKVDDFTVFFARIWVWDGLFHKHVAHILAAKPPSVV